MKSYFTFGQAHSHTKFGVTLDKDTVLCIEAADPCAVMFELFGTKWSMQYNTCPDMCYFPGGVYNFAFNNTPALVAKPV